MAMPILLNLRAIERTSKSKFVFALSSYALDDSGVLFEFEHDDSYEHPWGVLIKQVKGGEIGFFSMMKTETLQKLSSALSTYLNSGNGHDNDGNPIALNKEEMLSITEKIITIFTEGENIVVETVVNHQSELTEAISSLDYFKGGAPEHVSKPQKIDDKTSK